MNPCASFLFALLLFNALPAQDAPRRDDNPYLVIIKFSSSKQPRGKGSNPNAGAYLDELNNRTRAELRNEQIRNEKNPSAGEAKEYQKNEQTINRSASPARPEGSGDRFLYKLSVKNVSGKDVRALAWSYLSFDSATGDEVGRVDLLSEAEVKAGKKKDIEIFAVTPPARTISAAAAKTNDASRLRQEVVINRIEFKDGTTWHRIAIQ